MVSTSNVAVLALVGAGAALLFFKGGDIAKGVSDFFAGLNPLKGAGDAAAGFGQAAGQGFNLYLQNQSELARDLSPAGQAERIVNTYYTYATDYQKNKQIAENQNVKFLTSQVPVGTGNYYGASVVNPNGSITFQTPTSAQKAGTQFFLTGGNSNMSNQAKIASVLGVSPSVINAGVNKLGSSGGIITNTRQPASQTSAALIAYLH